MPSNWKWSEDDPEALKESLEREGVTSEAQAVIDRYLAGDVQKKSRISHHPKHNWGRTSRRRGVALREGSIVINRKNRNR